MTYYTEDPGKQNLCVVLASFQFYLSKKRLNRGKFALQTLPCCSVAKWTLDSNTRKNIELLNQSAGMLAEKCMLSPGRSFDSE